MGFAASVNMQPGDALMAQDVIYRHDGSVMKHWGWERINTTALAARPLAHKSFSFKGKNSPAGSTARGGNFGLANDGANYTRRVAFYSTAIALTEGECRYWDPATSTYAGPVALPGATAIAPDPKPTIIIHNSNAYIAGWADANLRYDPTDRALYEWGWAAAPANAGHAGVGAGGTLVAGAVYRYRASYVDIYTGEESALSVEYNQTTTAANRTITLDNFAVYPGTRHYNDGAGAAGDDVGIAVYRTDPDGQTYYFLDLLDPGTVALVDNGLAVDYSLRGDTRAFEDPPRLNTMTEFRDMWWGLSWDNNWARVYHNDFQGENSFWERWDPRQYREVPIKEGEVLTAVEGVEKSLIIMASLGAYELQAFPNTQTGLIDMSIQRLSWGVGCIGPRAKAQVDGYLYFLSDRGPYRWRPGMLKPEWIGKNLVPMFIDPESGLCQLTEGLRLESEACYDQDARVVRFIFPCGAAATLNRHIGYWVDTERYNQDPESGWVFYSTLPQCLDYGHALAPLAGGVPVDPFDRRPRMIFGEAAGYINEYDADSDRGALPAGVPAGGVIQAGSGVNLVVTTGGLFVLNDDMAGMRLEVVHTDGVVEVRTVATNTAVNIVPNVAFDRDPTDGLWYVGGVPSFWRSWVDSMGQPTYHKDIIHLFLGHNRESAATDYLLDVTFSASEEWPVLNTIVDTAQLNQYTHKMLIARIGRFFTYEVANSRPDERFMLTTLETKDKLLQGRRI